MKGKYYCELYDGSRRRSLCLRKDYIDNFGVDPEDIFNSTKEPVKTAKANTAMN